MIAAIVNFSVEPDITRLVDAGLVDQNWNQDAYNGIPFGSVVTIVTRPGNPKGIASLADAAGQVRQLMTDPTFTDGARRVAAVIRELPPPSEAVDELVALCG